MIYATFASMVGYQAGRIEAVSCDEVYLDISGLPPPPPPAFSSASSSSASSSSSLSFGAADTGCEGGGDDAAPMNSDIHVSVSQQSNVSIQQPSWEACLGSCLGLFPSRAYHPHHRLPCFVWTWPKQAHRTPWSVNLLASSFSFFVLYFRVY